MHYKGNFIYISKKYTFFVIIILASFSPNVITEPRHDEYNIRSRIFEFEGQIYINTRKKKRKNMVKINISPKSLNFKLIKNKKYNNYC